MRAAAPDVQDYTFAQKAAFVEKMQGRMAEINRDLERISATSKNPAPPSRPKPSPNIRRCAIKPPNYTSSLPPPSPATAAPTWDNVKAGSRTTYNELKNSFRHARQWASDKIAP